MLSKLTPEQRFWSQCDPTRTDGCVIWLGTITQNGYGQFGLNGKRIYAHHFLRGHPPKGLDTDHLCRNRACVWPDHLEFVTRVENARRGIKGVLTTHCPLGHAYDVVNTYVNPHGRRICRACRLQRQREARLSRLRLRCPTGATNT